MAREYSKKSSYPSKFSPGNFVSPAQRIVEQLCENIAAKDKKTLPNHFWQLEEWAKLFRNQITAANALLKENNISSVLEVLRNPRWTWVNSLRNKKFQEEVGRVSKNIDKQREKEELAEAELDIQIPEEVKTFGRDHSKKNVLDLL